MGDKILNFIYSNVNPDLYEEIDGIATTKHQFIKISDNTPEILIKVGLPNKPIMMPCSKILTGLTSDDSRNHGHKDEIGKKTLKKALPHLGDPLAVSYTEQNEFGVYLEDKASTGKPLYVYIRYDDKRDVNVILSVYGRVATKAEQFVYIDETRVHRKWDTNDYLVLKFKNRLDDEIYKSKCYTKNSIKRCLG